MATQFPQDPNAGRFIDGLRDQQANADEGMEFEMPDDDQEIEELPDGSAIVRMPTKGPMEDEDFYQNLAEVLQPYDLNKIALRYMDLVENDKKSREERDKKYEEGLRRTGMGNDAPGGATFMGASKVVHPVMAEACVDFASRAIKEMFPPDGPTRTKILGKVDEEKIEKAERKRDYMNWQLTEQIEEFRDEQEQLLTQLPLGGSQYMKLWYDDKKKRPCAEFMPIDNILLPFAAANFYTAQRVTEMQTLTEWEFKNRIRSGLYRDIDLIRVSAEPEETHSEKANNKIEGRKFEDNEDGLRKVYHIYTWLELDDDPLTDGESAPYILMVDEYENECVGLYRNWEEGDQTMTKLDWLVEFKFIPWRGAYAIGLPQLIGGLSAALTGSLRALLDSAHINNAATMLKLKGAKISGQSQQVDVTQVCEIEGMPGVDDIRKIAMPMPFNPPSPVLFSLLGWLDSAAKGVVTTAEEKIADVNSNTPVGTTQALIEQGAAVFSAIHARLHESQGRVLKILGRLNRWYIDEQRKGEVVADLEITKEDFASNTDVIPVSDPHIFSETQRMAQTQAVMALMDKNPDLFNRKVVLERFLKQIKVPGINELMKDVPNPEERPVADENVAMALGQMGFAFIDQDHLAHIQGHLDFAKDPAFGANPMIAPAFIPQMMEHVKQHITLWYLKRMNGYVTKSTGKQQADYANPKYTAEIDKIYALASQHVAMDSEKAFKGVMPVIQQMMQMMQQGKQQAPLPPEAQVLMQTSMAETQRRAAKDQADLQLADKRLTQEGQESAARMQMEMAKQQQSDSVKMSTNSADNLTKERIESAKLTRDAAKLQNEQAETALALQKEAQQTLGDRNGYI
jgi:hypothetical protein